VIGSACNFVANKVDVALLEEVATPRPKWTIPHRSGAPRHRLGSPAPRGARDRSLANPDLDGMAPHVVDAEGAEELAAAVENALASRAGLDVEARRRLASANTWEARARRLSELVGRELE